VRAALLLALAACQPKLTPEEAARAWSVDEVVAQPSRFFGKPGLRVRGVMVAGSLEVADRVHGRMRIAAGSRELAVSYVCETPDRLGDGSYGEFRGTLVDAPGGPRLDADRILIKLGRAPPR
jgi:hypothetical protein